LEPIVTIASLSGSSSTAKRRWYQSQIARRSRGRLGQHGGGQRRGGHHACRQQWNQSRGTFLHGVLPSFAPEVEIPALEQIPGCPEFLSCRFALRPIIPKRST